MLRSIGSLVPSSAKKVKAGESAIQPPYPGRFLLIVGGLWELFFAVVNVFDGESCEDEDKGQDGMSCEGIAEGGGEEADVCEGFARGRDEYVADAHIHDEGNDKKGEICGD